MKTIYCISGLGADERVFSHLHIEGHQINYLPWLLPRTKEPIHEYAKRMSESIIAEKPILMGLSFGGMMSIEIAKLMPVEKVILISSIKSTRELPVLMKWAGRLRINKLLPMRSYKVLEPLQNWCLGITTEEEKNLLHAYRRNISQVYMNWAINEILNWRNDWQPSKLFHIHGDDDKIFPIKKTYPTYVIPGGGHFMIMNKAEEVSSYINKALS